MDIMPEEVSKFVFSPDGESLYIYKKNFDNLKHSYDKKQKEFNALIKEHGIESFNLLSFKGYQAIYDECIKATTRAVKKLEYDVSTADPDRFIYDFMDEIYRVHYVEGKRDSTPHKSNTVAGLAAQRNDMQNIDAKGGGQDSTENLDSKLYEKLYALIEDDGDYEGRDILLAYARLKKMMADQTDKKNKSFFNNLERAVTEFDFVNSSFFKGDETEDNVTRLWCHTNYYRYSMVDDPVFMYRCLDCKREFSSLLYDKCPMCGSDRKIISSVLNGKYVSVGQQFVEELGDMARKLVNGADVDIDGYVNMLPDERYEFYETYFKDTFESLDTKLTDEFITPLGELEAAIENGGYSDERYDQLRAMVDAYNALPDMKRNRLDKEDFGPRSSLLVDRYGAEHDRIIMDDYRNRVQTVLAGEPSRAELEDLRDRFSRMGESVAAMVRMSGLDRRVEDAIAYMNSAESSRCLEAITASLSACDFSDLEDARRRLEAARSSMTSLHPGSRAEFDRTIGKQLVDDFEGKLQYHQSLSELKPLIAEVDMVYGMSMDDMLSVFDGLHSKFTAARANPRYAPILDGQGCTDKVADMHRRVVRCKVERAEAKVSSMLSDVTRTDLTADTDAVERIDRFVAGLQGEVVAEFREGAVYREYVSVKNDVQRRRDEADAYNFNSDMTALEGITELSRFENAYQDLKALQRSFNTSVNEIIRTQYDFDYRMAELDRRFRQMKMEEYTDGFVDRFGAMRATFDAVTADQVDSLSKEIEGMSTEAQDSLSAKIGDEGRRAIDDMIAAKHAIIAAEAEVDSLMGRDFDPDMYSDIRSADEAVSRIPEAYRDRFLCSPRAKAYRDKVTAYGQWQLTHMVKDIASRTEAIGAGDSDYFKENPEVRSLHERLMPAVSGLPDVADLMEKFDSLKGSRIDRSKELAKIVADCEADYSEENIRRYNECCEKLSDSENGIENVRALKNRFANAEAAYWAKAAGKITKTVDRDYGLFANKISTDDAADIAEAFALYESMPEKYASLIEKSKVKKLNKLHSKI